MNTKFKRNNPLSIGVAILSVALLGYACKNKEDIYQTVVSKAANQETSIPHAASAVTPSDNAISPDDYVKLIGKGFDVQWAQYKPAIRAFNEKVVKDIKDAGFSNARLRTDLEANDPVLIDAMTKSIDACLKYDIIPIIAYGALKLEEAKPEDTSRIMDEVVEWWKIIATRYANYSHKLSFNLFIEMSGYLKGNYAVVNQLYSRILKEIRAVSPKRIVILPSPDISDPINLDKIILPTNDNYIMAEWHFYASGPSKKGKQKQWTTGTPEERKLLTDKIDIALNWMRRTGKKTWVGAWMAGNYNKGNEYTAEEQVRFATFMVRELAKYDIPWSINSDDKFYDPVDNRWINRSDDAGSIAVRDVLVDPDKIAIYSGDEYLGRSERLAVGEYNSNFLREKGLYDGIYSLMVPFGFVVEVYTQDDFGGTPIKYDFTQKSLSGVKVKSLKVIDKKTYN